jgi:hypothetical protein
MQANVDARAIYYLGPGNGNRPATWLLAGREPDEAGWRRRGGVRPAADRDGYPEYAARTVAAARWWMRAVGSTAAALGRTLDTPIDASRFQILPELVSGRGTPAKRVVEGESATVFKDHAPKPKPAHPAGAPQRRVMTLPEGCVGCSRTPYGLSPRQHETWPLLWISTASCPAAIEGTNDSRRFPHRSSAMHAGTNGLAITASRRAVPASEVLADVDREPARPSSIRPRPLPTTRLRRAVPPRTTSGGLRGLISLTCIGRLAQIFCILSRQEGGPDALQNSSRFPHFAPIEISTN